VSTVATYTTDPAELERALSHAHLGLDPTDLEEVLRAIGDREDQAGGDARARLARGRRALERELAATLES